MEKVEIIQQMVAELKKRGLVEKQKDIADQLNVKPAVVSSAMHGHPNGCTQSFINKLNKGYGGIFNPEWLVSGEGPMLLADAQKSVQIDASTHHNADRGGMVIEGVGDDVVITLQIQNRMLKAENESLRRDVARLEEEKSKLEKRNDELFNALLDRTNPNK